MKIFLLPEDLRNGLVAYLSQQPFKDVSTGVQALLTLEEYTEEDELLKSNGH